MQTDDTPTPPPIETVEDEKFTCSMATEERVKAMLQHQYVMTCMEDWQTMRAVCELADLAKWILAHCNENLGKVKLCITANNPHQLPIEALFLKMKRQNPL